MKRKIAISVKVILNRVKHIHVYYIQCLIIHYCKSYTLWRLKVVRKQSSASKIIELRNLTHIIKTLDCKRN